MGEAVANELLLIVPVAPVFFADARCQDRLSTTISSRWVKSLKSAMALGELRVVMLMFERSG